MEGRRYPAVAASISHSNIQNAVARYEEACEEKIFHLRLPLELCTGSHRVLEYKQENILGST
jgi:hypothetical protein